MPFCLPSPDPLPTWFCTPVVCLYVRDVRLCVWLCVCMHARLHTRLHHACLHTLAVNEISDFTR